jgi:hypothetical protein
MLVLAEPIGRLFDVPFAAVVGIGAATLVWAWLLTRLARQGDWRSPLRLVAAANAAASVGVAVLAALAPALAGRVLLLAVAVEVAAFAAIQLRVLVRARAAS